ncbi:MAG: glycosyltransferase family 39 protein [Phycisphaerae bacterium]|nr:glycosyltransferase family 39 protein [Phycisphaerae bacterium]
MSAARSQAAIAPFLISLALALCGAALHLVYLLTYRDLNLSGDEAHYWEWSRRLDLSYYSKGPLVAYIIAAGRAMLGDWSRSIFGNDTLAVRGPAILLGVLTSLGVHALAARVFRDGWIGTLAVALCATIPIMSVGGLLMTIDAPLVCAWVWCLYCVARGAEGWRGGAVEGRRSSSGGATLWWLAAGVLVAVGLLAKYNMVLAYLVVGIWLLMDQECRGWWRRPAVLTAAIVGLLGLVPILIWNASHDWVSFRHVAGQAGVADRVKFDLGAIAAYVGGQAAVIGPIWLVMMLVAIARLWKGANANGELRVAIGELQSAHPAEPREASSPSASSPLRPSTPRLLALAALVPWLFFLLFSPITKIQPNWPAMAIPPATIALAWLIRTGWNATTGRAALRRWTVAGAAIGLGMVMIAHRADLLMPLFKQLARGAPPWDLTPTAKFDPTVRLRGWAQLGAAVGEVLNAERAAGREPFILCDDYQLASQVAFYAPGEPTVYSAASALGRRRSQYDIWINPLRNAPDFVGRPCVYIGSLHTDEGISEAALAGPLPGLRLARSVEHRVQGEPVQIWTIYVCDAFAGFAGAAAEKY